VRVALGLPPAPAPAAVEAAAAASGGGSGDGLQARALAMPLTDLLASPLFALSPTAYLLLTFERAGLPQPSEFLFLRECLLRFLGAPGDGMEEELWTPIATILKLQAAEVETIRRARQTQSAWCAVALSDLPHHQLTSSLLASCFILPSYFPLLL
jgi:hypothetical protein